MLTNSVANTVSSNPVISIIQYHILAAVSRLRVHLYNKYLFAVPGLLLWSLFAHAEPEQRIPEPELCSAEKYQEKVTVKKVIDGDTIIITDDRHIRLIGINTPELGHDQRKSELGAEQARDFLSRLLKTNPVILLKFDSEHFDRYDRTLAHVFLQNGANVQSILLKRGLATPLVIPPNLEFMECYQTSSVAARKHKIGLWALRQYQTKPVEAITINDLGYRLISGVVTRIGESKSSLWINMGPKLALRITRNDLEYFDNSLLQILPGKQLSARGWIYFTNGEFRMRIRHPADLELNSN